jgi:hypothetical protein
LLTKSVTIQPVGILGSKKAPLTLILLDFFLSAAQFIFIRGGNSQSAGGVTDCIKMTCSGLRNCSIWRSYAVFLSILVAFT